MLSWFSVRDLARVFRRRGRSEDHVFRPYFLPVLEALLVYLRSERTAA
jgi:hypothetical protein